MAEALYWVSLWYFRKENINHFQWHSLLKKPRYRKRLMSYFLGSVTAKDWQLLLCHSK